MAMVRLWFWYDALPYWCRPRHLQHRQRHSDWYWVVGTDLNDTGLCWCQHHRSWCWQWYPHRGVGSDTFVYNSGGDTITDFGGNDIFQISASGFGGGLEEGIALSMSASTTGVFVSDANNPTGTSANFLYNTGTGVLGFDSMALA